MKEKKKSREGPPAGQRIVGRAAPETRPLLLLLRDVWLDGTTAATADSDGQDVTGQTQWQWDFGDGGASTDNPTTYTYAQTGAFTVTLTGTYNGQQATDSLQAQVGGAQGGWDGQQKLLVRWACPDPACPPVDGTTVCDQPLVCAQCNSGWDLVGFYMKDPTSGQWDGVPALEGGRNFAPPGSPYSEFRAEWIMEQGGINTDYEWKAEFSAPEQDPPAPALATFTRHDVVAVNRVNKILRYDPAPGSGLDECQIPWGIDHLDPACVAEECCIKFSVCIKVFEVSGSREDLVWHKHLANLGPTDQGTVTWRGETAAGYGGPESPPGGPGSAPKGIYKYRVGVAHVDTFGPEEDNECDIVEEPMPQTDLEKSRILEPRIRTFTYGTIAPVEGGGHTTPIQIGYYLNRDAATCQVKVFDPDLQEVASFDGLESSAGAHWTDWRQINVRVTEDGQLAPGYQAVVFATESNSDGTWNRDKQARPALQHGASPGPQTTARVQYHPEAHGHIASPHVPPTNNNPYHEVTIKAVVTTPDINGELQQYCDEELHQADGWYPNPPGIPEVVPAWPGSRPQPELLWRAYDEDSLDFPQPGRCCIRSYDYRSRDNPDVPGHTDVSGWGATVSHNMPGTWWYRVEVGVQPGAVTKADQITRISWRDTGRPLDANDRPMLEWATSFYYVPYEYGGWCYGGAIDRDPDANVLDWNSSCPGGPTSNEWGTDCSGLVCAAGVRAGYAHLSPRLTVTGIASDAHSTTVSKEELQPGDILCLIGEHCKIYVSGGHGTQPTIIIESAGSSAHPPSTVRLDAADLSLDQLEAAGYVWRRLKPPQP